MLRKFFGKGKEASSGEPANKTERSELTQAEVEAISRIHTDAEFLQAHCRLMDRFNKSDTGHVSHLPILESSFIERSAKTYAAPWAGRELIQNWIDAEVISVDGVMKKEKGTLDGVTFKEETLANGLTKFTISGDWALTNLDGLVGLSSDKPDGPTSGGNGIGLKQTALRFLRDAEFGVKRFYIYATSKQTDTPVKITYEMISPEDIQTQYAVHKTSPMRNIRKSWLMGRIEDTDAITIGNELPEHKKSRDACAYVIETDNEDTIKLLRGIKDYGVSSENPHLHDPDFESKKGMLKWEKSRQSNGKLFLNGQVMDYEKKTTDKLIFPGPAGVTIRLSGVEYPMSIDRPPIDFIQLRKYIEDLLKDEPQSVLIDQLRDSEHLWHLSSSDADVSFSNSDGYNVVVQSIIKNLLPDRYAYRSDKKTKPPFTYDDFKAVFGDRYVYAEEYGTKKGDILEAEKMGYRVCLSEFAKIGVPSIKEVIDSSAKLKKNRPRENSLESSKNFGWEMGTRVFYEKQTNDPLRLKFTPEVFLNNFNEIKKSVSVDGKNVKIVFEVPAGEELLTDDLAERDENNTAENIIYACRGLIVSGLRSASFVPESTAMTVDGRVLTFCFIDKKTTGGKGDGILVGKIPEIKTIDQKSREQIVLEFSMVNEDDIEGWKKLQGELGLDERSVDTVTENGIESDAGELETVAPGKNEGQHVVSPNKDGQVDEKKRKLKEKLSKAPVVNTGDRAIVGVNSEMTFVPVIISDDNVKRFKEVQKAIPHLEDVVVALEDASKSNEIKPLTAREALMLQWLNSVDNRALGVSNEGMEDDSGSDNHNSSLELYLRPNTLILSLANILEANNQANIPISLPVVGNEKTREVVSEAVKLQNVGKRIEAVAKKFIPDAESLEDFELVSSPNQEQLKKLALLKAVMLATGYEAGNDLFVFKGNNVKGFNLDQKAIGLHESVLGVEFKEAFTVFRHEIAHNRVMSHNSEFIATDEAIASHFIESMSLAASRLLDAQLSLMRRGLSVEEIESEIATKYAGDFLIVNASKIWEEMGRKTAVSV